jgi:[acyl-carrier-protein] S-malonyltransferase
LVHEVGDEWSNLCSAQLCSPVRWRQTVDQLITLGADLLVEVGPGNVLTGLAKRITPDTKAINVSTPDDLETLVATLAKHADTADAEANEDSEQQHHGEKMFLQERLVVSTVTGLFDFVQPPNGPKLGDTLEVGALVAMVGENEVRTPFPGTLMGTLAIPGERVTIGQPVAWLRMEDATAS